MSFEAPAFCDTCASIVPVPWDASASAVCSRCGEAVSLSRGEEVFISYSTANLDAASRLAHALRQAGLNVWFAPDSIGLGEDFTRLIPPAIAACKVMVLLLSEEGLSSHNVANEIVAGQNQRKRLIPVLLGDLLIPENLKFSLNRTQYLVADAELSGAYVERVVARVREDLAPAIVEEHAARSGVPTPPKVEPAGIDPAVKVYIGPKPFPEQTETRFFGRDAEQAKLVRLLVDAEDRRVILLTSPSGAGKSSLLTAGIKPLLRSGGHQVWGDARIGRALADRFVPLHGKIDNVFSFNVLHGLGDRELTPDTMNLTLAQGLRGLPKPEPGKLRVLILDQFEEIFTQHRGRFEDRVGFTTQLHQAIEEDPGLRVLLAMRQEYLVESELVFADAPEQSNPLRVQLDRMKREALLEVIRRPAEEYAAYAPGVAEQIIDQLNLVRFKQPDGRVQEKPGEFVELVHLQIVCSQLWDELSPETKLIRFEDLSRAAASLAGGRFEDFVRNALDVYYQQVIQKVAGSAETARMGGFPESLIKLGCLKFVTADGTRRQVQETEERTGRLPNWIINQLSARHLVRPEQVNRERWWELSHDLLAEMVNRARDPAMQELLFGAELLEKRVERIREESPTRGMTGYFRPHADMLRACSAFQAQEGLSAEESELVFRAALATRIDVPAWTDRIQRDFPEVYARVIDDALGQPEREVRLSATHSLIHAAGGDDRAARRVASLLCHDPNRKVRRAAAEGVLTLNHAGLYEFLLQPDTPPADPSPGEGSPPTVRPSYKPAPLLRALADVWPAERSDIARFERAYRALPTASRVRVRLAAWGLRLLAALPVLPYLFIPAAVLGAVSAGAFKAFTGTYNWALVQAEAGAGIGMFQGVVPGVIWGGGIVVALALHRLVFWKVRGKRSLIRPAGALVAGLIGGLVTSVIVVGLITSVYTLNSLNTMGWIDGFADKALGQDVEHVRPVRYGGEFMHDLFIKTRLGWAHLIQGTALGLGLALTTNALRASGRWDSLLNQVDGLNRKVFFTTTRRITQLVARYAWATALPLACACAVVTAISVPGSEAAEQKKQEWVWVGSVADGMTQLVGGSFAVVGLGLGIIVLRRGLVLEPRSEAM